MIDAKLESVLKAIDREITLLHAKRDAVLALLGKPPQTPIIALRTKHDAVVKYIVDFIRSQGTPKRARDILAYINSLGVTIASPNGTNRETLGSALASESKKADGRLIKVDRGLYDIRKENSE